MGGAGRWFSPPKMRGISGYFRIIKQNSKNFEELMIFKTAGFGGLRAQRAKNFGSFSVFSPYLRAFGGFLEEICSNFLPCTCLEGPSGGNKLNSAQKTRPEGGILFCFAFILFLKRMLISKQNSGTLRNIEELGKTETKTTQGLRGGGHPFKFLGLPRAPQGFRRRAAGALRSVTSHPPKKKTT